MRQISVLTVLALISAAAFACQEEGAERQPGEIVEGQKGKLEEQRDEYIREAQRRLESLDEKRQALRERLDDLSGEAKQEAQTALGELSEQRRDLARRLDEARSASAEAWSGFREELDRRIEQLEDKYDKTIEALEGVES